MRARPDCGPSIVHRRSALLILGCQIALAVIAALGAARRAITTGLGFVARTGLLAAGALHQHAAALAVGDHATLGRNPGRLLDARRRCLAVAALAFLGHREFRAGLRDDLSPSCSRSTRVLT